MTLHHLPPIVEHIRVILHKHTASLWDCRPMLAMAVATRIAVQLPWAIAEVCITLITRRHFNIPQLLVQADMERL